MFATNPLDGGKKSIDNSSYNIPKAAILVEVFYLMFFPLSIERFRITRKLLENI